MPTKAVLWAYKNDRRLKIINNNLIREIRSLLNIGELNRCHKKSPISKKLSGKVQREDLSV